ncbi:hypothetical protein KHA94_16265 [Bacillus sp. FJAT-49705]|uniref:Uncharacterized protein n=1 Tax=Cytobacillus citreus TaxID=2833586 RepID=A0ABS5NV91_9BACI|nr:hypothetical protein [Cytobacillus citreus]MBS4191745.1 hypothetical protein [Cytobacillus citreus]
MLETDLRTYLLTFDSLKSKISNRLYPGWIPENAVMPSVAYLGISRPSHHDIDVAYPRYQFSVFSPKYIEAKEIVAEIRGILQRFKGQMGNSNIIQVVYENEYENYEKDTKLYHIAIDFKFIFWE